VFYRLLKHLVGICFNLLNLVLAGNLPPLGCVTVIVEQDGRFLLIRRPKGKLSFPSGFMRWREMPVEAAKRECKEETGLELQIDPNDLVCCYVHISQHFNTMSTLTLVYSGKVIGGMLRGSIEGQAYWLDEESMGKDLEKRCETLLADYFQFRTKRAQMPGSKTIPQETAKEDRYDNNFEGSFRGES
jgi:ADP-ribose pyrophosphatase YjhB (NUDIX family)